MNQNKFYRKILALWYLTAKIKSKRQE